MTQELYLPRTLKFKNNPFREEALLVAKGVYIILAEPGAGKTELLESLAGSLGVRADNASIFHHRNSTAPSEYLVLDALDEVAKLDPSGIDAIFVKAQETGAKLVIFSSRSSEWEEAREIRIRECFGADPKVVRLQPFDEDDQKALFSHHMPDEDFSAFKRELEKFDLESLLGNPQFLRLFAEAFVESGRAFTTKKKLIEIIAYADEDAYTIFETMNDRGLSLTPTDMLKGYLLANIDEPAKRLEADKLIKKYLSKFAGYGDGTESDFFKAWLRSQYAKKIRERKKDAKPEDFDLIGTEYHRWIRNHASEIGLKSGTDFHQFVIRDFRFFAAFYIRLLDASRQRVPDMESVKYNADAGFTLQHHVTLAAISADDEPSVATAKAATVADFLDCWLNLRLWNYKSNSYSSMQYSVFTIIRDVRGKSLADIRAILHRRLMTEQQDLSFDRPVGLNQFTGKAVHRQLARFTDWLEQQAGEPGRYEDYIVRSGKNAYEIEHLWANHYERFAEEFPQQNDFDTHRNLIGGLILLPKKVNASLNDATYENKAKHYLKANPLAQTLHADYYEKNPGFTQMQARTGLKFVPYQDFHKDNLLERSALYCALAAHIWSPDRLLSSKENN